MLKNLLLAGVAMGMLAGAAQAADVVEPVAYDWSGPYVGLQAGYGWDAGDLDIEGKDLDYDASTLSADGFVGGAHLGYLLQSDSFVYGIEGDIEFADMKDKTSIFGSDNGGVTSYELSEVEKKIDWLGSLRLRAGFAMDRALIYATGGLAVGGVKLDADFEDVELPDFYLNEQDRSTEWGWTLGAGLEYALTDDVSARIEYRYTDLGKTKLNLKDPDDGSSAGELEVENNFHAVRAGVSWRF